MPANTEARRRAEEALRSLESQWISLLHWVAEKLGLSDDELLGGWTSDLYLTSRDRLEKDSRGLAEAPWTVLSYLDFGRYPELAGFGEYGRILESLGSPPRNWRAVIDEQNTRAGAIQYRNHLAHGGRFDALPPEKQEEAAILFQAQRDHLKTWWPDAPISEQSPIPAESPYRTAIRLLSTDPNSAASLVEQLGMEFMPNAPNIITDSAATPISTALANGFLGLHRVGKADLHGANAAVYLAYLPEWSLRSSEREKSRRKLAKALIEHQVQDPRWLAVLMDGTGRAQEAEFIVPRQRTGKAFGTIRASVNLQEPSRYHVELLDELKVRPGTTLPELSRQWNQALSVERVTNRFYDEFRELRDRIVEALLEHNADNPAIAGKDRGTDKVFGLQLHAFGTRQLGRMLFLWFIQQKRWLGGTAGDGETDFILELFRKHKGDGVSFHNDVLLPIFFDGLGLPLHDEQHKAVEAQFGPLPFLGGGLFRAGADEFEGQLLGLQGEGTRANRITLPDDLFDPLKDQPSEGSRPSTERTVLGLLRGYRFTTQESTPDDQSVDPDPELLGKVFENLYQGDDRHDTGAYYTPREIVHFMCRQALDGYLRSRAGVDQGTLDWLREEAIDWTVSDRRLTPADRSALVEALDNVKIVDPAVGSGAFLVASLQEIVLLRRGIVQSAADRDIEAGSVDVADWKRRTITNSLYGVDINPMAVEICHLRLWLSMVVELDVSNYSDIPALPNLDLRVVAGDSLIDRMGEERFVHSLGGDGGVQASFDTVDKVGRLLTEIENLQGRFAGEGIRDPMRLVELRNDIRHKQMEIARIQLDEAITGREERLAAPKRAAKTTQAARRRAEQQLTNLGRLRDGLRNDAPHQKPFLWPVNFPEVFERGGFDIVVANPPYERMELIDNADEAAYALSFPEVSWTRADLLVYFYGRAVQLLHEHGQLAFITSNKYMRAAYGENLRSFLPSSVRIRSIIDFGDLPLFTAAAYPAVLIGEKDSDFDSGVELTVADLVYPIRVRLASDSVPVNTDNVRIALEGLSDLLANSAVSGYPHLLLRRQGWILEEPTLVALFERLMKHGTALAQLPQVRTYMGVKTGLNAAFVIDERKREGLIRQDRASEELIMPWLRGRDIRRWTPAWAGLYVIFTCRGTDIDRYPAIREHLEIYRNKLERRATSHAHPWYELQQPQEGVYQEFEQTKIVWPRNVPPWECRFAVDENGAFINDKAYILTGVDVAICDYLNSPLCLWLLDKLTTKLRGGYLELKSEAVVGRLPVPGEIARLDRSTDETLHSGVCRLFDLGASESSQIWEWYQHRQIYRGGSELAGDVDLENDD